MEREAEYLKRVFRGKQDILCAKLEERLRCFYDQSDKSEDEKVRLSFAIGGFVRVIKDYISSDIKGDISQLAETTARMLEFLLKSKRSTADAMA